jgi:urea transport system substrate-binding protein
MRSRAALLGGLALVTLALLAAGWAFLTRPPATREPIVVGVLHALTGTMAVSEAPVVAATRLAVDEINAAGGLLGWPVLLVLEDTRSDPATAAAAAERLISQKHAAVLAGCWTSACRKAVLPVVEDHRHLLLYPVQHDGLEQSAHVLYLGAAPNQQILPATGWALQGFGRRVYLVGSDYVFPRTANALLRDFVQLGGGQVLAERYLPLGATDMSAVLDDLRRLKPDLVLNTINGSSNQALFEALVDAGLTDLPMLSFSAAEPEMQAYGGGRLERHFVAWSYLQSLDTPQNRHFLAALHRAGNSSVATSDPAASAYAGVQLWAAAVREVGSPQTEAVNANLVQQSVVAPFGIAAVDPQTRHLWRQLRIAQVQPDGQLLEVYAQPRHIKPSPWPSYRSAEHWTSVIGSDGH